MNWAGGEALRDRVWEEGCGQQDVGRGSAGRGCLLLGYLQRVL